MINLASERWPRKKPSYLVLGLENYIKAFPVVFGQNECVHRALRLIFSQKRPGRSSRSSGYSNIFSDFLVIFGFSLALNHLRNDRQIVSFDFRNIESPRFTFELCGSYKNVVSST